MYIGRDRALVQENRKTVIGLGSRISDGSWEGLLADKMNSSEAARSRLVRKSTRYSGTMSKSFVFSVPRYMMILTDPQTASQDQRVRAL